MTDREDLDTEENRERRLDLLYDAACERLLNSGKFSSGEKDTAFGIIDRWLAKQEADRQFELTHKVNLKHVCERCGDVGNDVRIGKMAHEAMRKKNAEICPVEDKGQHDWNMSDLIARTDYCSFCGLERPHQPKDD